MENKTKNNILNKKLISKCNISKCDDNIISLTLFGSYNTEFWNEDRSDIDILVLVKHRDFNIEYKLEECYFPMLSSYFESEKIHFTFIELRDFDSVFGDIYIDYEDKVIFDISEHFNYLMYISKYNRVNESLINLVKSDWKSKYGDI